MKQETKTHSKNSVSTNCQNCKKDFTIEPDDFSFYEKIKAPPPTFCPECRQIRRYAWRNERSLFKTTCGNCQKNIFSAYPTASIFPVFCRECWLSDAWDPFSYAQDYDFSKPFFEQFKKLFDKVPRLHLFQANSTNSDYSNIIRDCKNVYLSYSVVIAEDVHYSKNIDHSRQIFDSLCIDACERCAYLVYGANNYDTFYSVYTRTCLNSYFLFDCVNCSNCFMSSNLRNKQYVFRNEQYSKEEYEKLIKEKNLGSYKIFEELIKEFDNLTQTSIHKYADIIKSTNATGHALANVKNAHSCFEAYDMENVKWTSRCFAIKDSYDVNNTGLGSELCYEYTSGGTTMSKVLFSLALLSASSELYYSGWCGGSSNLFGCFGIRNKQYCILNKQYTKEEYEEILPKIIEHMNSMPYVGANGRIYKFGEFFPFELSPFAYNESDAQELSPLSEEEIKNKRYNFREAEEKKYEITKSSEDIPDLIEDVEDEILKEIISCPHKGECLHQCTTAFRITEEELKFYKTHNLPLPRFCPNCRHYKRLEYRNPWKLWHRKCMKEECYNEFETSYAPERPEIVYCEKCYQQEVY